MRCGRSTSERGSSGSNYIEHYGDPLWVYYQYRLAKNDRRPKDAIYAEGQAKMREVEARGVDLATGHGEQIWDLNRSSRPRSTSSTPTRKCPWAELTPEFAASIPNVLPLRTCPATATTTSPIRAPARR